jgi:hypothetical protein
VREQRYAKKREGIPINSKRGDVRMRAYRNNDTDSGHPHVPGDSGTVMMIHPGGTGTGEDEMTIAGHPFRCGRMHP